MPKQFFITLEGGEGAGKSTQARQLAAKLQSEGHTVLLTREPGGSPNAEQIRHLLVNGAPDRWSPTAETLLNYAARDSHLNETIRPALSAGKVVICDRFMDSTMAYQGAAGGAEMALINQLQNIVVGETVPDLTLVFDLQPETGLARTHARNGVGEDRYENKALTFHHTLRQAFLDLVKQDPKRCKRIDANQSVEQVFDAVWMHVKQGLDA
jgi:dTMP kinase